MMRLVLQKFWEPQKDWYAKKGVSVNRCMFFFHVASDIQIEIHNLFSNGNCVLIVKIRYGLGLLYIISIC